MTFELGSFVTCVLIGMLSGGFIHEFLAGGSASMGREMLVGIVGGLAGALLGSVFNGGGQSIILISALATIVAAFILIKLDRSRTAPAPA